MPVKPSSAPLPPPNCPRCGAQLTPGEASCGKCGYALLIPPVDPTAVVTPPSAASALGVASSSAPLPANGFSIGIWGTKQSGKTMYLGMLRINIMRQHRPMWGMVPHNSEASRFITAVNTALAKHEFPPPTVQDEPESLWFEISKQDRITNRDLRYPMRVLDMPGEWYENPERAFVSPQGVNVLEEYLMNSQGLLCLVDPTDSKAQKQLNVYLANLLQTLFIRNSHKRLNKRFAFCLTKMDLPGHRQHRRHPEPYVKEKLGTMLVDNLKQFCAPGTVNFNFACSAVGFYPGISTERSNSGIDWQGRSIIYEPDKIQPFGLLEPLEWLLKDVTP